MKKRRRGRRIENPEAAGMSLGIVMAELLSIAEASGVSAHALIGAILIAVAREAKTSPRELADRAVEYADRLTEAGA